MFLPPSTGKKMVCTTVQRFGVYCEEIVIGRGRGGGFPKTIFSNKCVFGALEYPDIKRGGGAVARVKKRTKGVVIVRYMPN